MVHVKSHLRKVPGSSKRVRVKAYNRKKSKSHKKHRKSHKKSHKKSKH
jgi:hypothetical protein